METGPEQLEQFALEARDRLTRIETRLEHMATKADLQELQSTMIKWLVGTVGALGVAGITAMTFVLNNAAPRIDKPAQAPLIITLPPQGQQSPPAR